MSKTRRGLCLLLCVVMVFSLFTGFPIECLELGTEANAVDSNTNTDGTSEWVTAWHTSMMFLNGSSESGMGTAVDTLSMMRQRNFRTLIQLTMGGDTIRLTYSNKYSTDDELLIGEITLAEGTEDPDVWADGSADKFVAITNQFDSTETKHLVGLEAAFADAIAAGDAELKDDYYGNYCIAIKPGKTVTTNAIDVSSLDLQALDYLSVTTWTNNMMDFDEGFTGGLIGGVTRYLGSAGLGNIFDANANYSESEDLYYDAEFLAPVTLSSSDDSGDYNIIPFLSTIEVKRDSIDGVTNTNDAYTTVILGDSTVANDIPVKLAQQLASNNIDGVAVTWAAVKGNELLLNGQSSVQALEEALAPEDETGTSDKCGPLMDEAGIQVIDEVLSLSGVKKVIVKLGINDILHPYCNNLTTNYDHKTTAAEIIAGYKYLIDKCHDAGVEIYFYELTPWYGYTRDDHLTYSDSIDSIRRTVNTWLATYGKEYDEYKTLGRDTNTDSYSGSVSLGSNYGSTSGEQSCDNIYSRFTTTYNNSAAFDTFGYISLDSMCSGTSLNRGYTTDGIHFNEAGQGKVAKLTPMSIFVDTEAYAATAASEVNISGLMFRTTSLAANNEYVICNTNGVVNTDAGRGNNTDITIYNNTTYNQSITGYAVSNTKTQHADGDAVYNADISGQAIAEKTSLGVADIKVQCGTSQVGYVVKGGLPSTTIWTLQGGQNTYVWNNDGWYLAWYWYASWSGDRVFPTSVINYAPMTSGDDSLESITNDDWYSFDHIADQGNGMVDLYYESMTGANKNLVFFNKNMDKYWKYVSDGWFSYHYELSSLGTNYGPQYAASLQNGTALYDEGERVGVFCDTYNLALFSTQSNSVKAKLDVTGSEINTTTDKTVFSGKANGSTIQLNFQLNSQLYDSNGNLTGTSYTDAPSNNEAKGPFQLYTFGDNQKVFWMSTDKSVATVTNSTTSDYNYYSGGGKVTFTGAGGTTDIVANYLWSEYDGTTYVFDNNNNAFYTTAQKDAYIAAGTKPHSSTENGYHWIEITNDTWVWTNYKWLQTQTELTNIADYDVDITLDGSYGTNDTFSLTDVEMDETASLAAIEITDPVGVDFLGDHWSWSSSNTGVASISDTIDDYATLKFTGVTGSTVITATRVDASGNAVTDPADGQVIKSSITVNTTAAIPEIDIFVSDGSNPDEYYVEGVAIGDAISLTAKVVDSDNVAYTVKSWSWTLVDDSAHGAATSTYFSLSQSSTTASQNTSTVTVKKAGQGLIKATLTLSDNTQITSYIVVTTSYDMDYTTNTLVDFGLPVKVDVNAQKLSTAKPSVALVTGRTKSDEFTKTSVTTTNGSASVADGVVTYTPTKIASTTDTIYYSSQFNSGYKYSDIAIVPATSVYYEDSFVSFGQIDYSNNTLGDFSTSGSKWVTDGTTATNVYQSVDSDAYGYDAAYGNFTTYSMGSAKKVTVSSSYGSNGGDVYPAAQFTFTGTGFELYSFTTATAGAANVYVDKLNSDGSVASTDYLTINNYSQQNYYQTPVISWTDKTYGTYKVTVEVCYDKYFDKTGSGQTAGGSYAFWVDAVRIYSPVDQTTSANSSIIDLYKSANEAFASYTKVRDLIKSASTFNSLSSGSISNAAVFVDATLTEKDGHYSYSQSDITTTVSDYKNDGPKNEVYLQSTSANKAQGVSFTLTNASNAADIQIGAKLVSGSEGKLTVIGTKGSKTITLNTATNMYYSIADVVGSDGQVTLVNANGTTIVSVTNVKVTFASAATPSFAMSAPALTFAKSSVSNTLFATVSEDVEPTVEPTTEPTAEPTVEPTVEPTAEPTAEPTVEPTVEPTAEPTAEPTVEPTPEPTVTPDDPDDDDDDDDQSVFEKMFAAIKNFFTKLFGGK